MKKTMIIQSCKILTTVVIYKQIVFHRNIKNVV